MSEQNFRLDSKFLRDSAWNYCSFILMAATGVILNFTIAAKLGVESLGIFNQIYAVYIISAHFSVLGIHESAQKYVAQHFGEKNAIDTITLSALLISIVFGLLIASVLYLLSGPIGKLADSPYVGKGVALTTPGLFLFAINKVLMAVLNGEQRMKEFALAQSVRVLVILISCLLIILFKLESYMLGACFTIAEMILIFPLFLIVQPRFKNNIVWLDVFEWGRHHFSFGSRALTNGFLAESYIRVDILMLSVFVSDYAVGIYSFAALFIEGLYQIPGITRTIVNPILVKIIASKTGLLPLAHFCRRIIFFSGAIFILIGGLVLILFPYLNPFFPDQLVENSYPLLIILATGLWVYSAFIPLDFIFLQAGMPGRQSLLMAWNVSLNFLLNLILIPYFGIYGAAWATSISFLFSVINLNLATSFWLNLPGGILFFGTKIRRAESK